MFVGMPLPIIGVSTLIAAIYAYEQFGLVEAFIVLVLLPVFWLLFLVAGGCIRVVLEDYGILQKEVTE
jgi:hypothetical protein